MSQTAHREEKNPCKERLQRAIVVMQQEAKGLVHVEVYEGGSEVRKVGSDS